MNISFAVLMIVAAFVGVRWGPVRVTHLLLGLLTGLALGGTALGAGILTFALDMLTTLSGTLNGVVA
jgi:hypothetical protein